MSYSTNCTYWSIQDQADYPIPCINEVGSPNLVTGEVKFSDYGYTLTRWVCYLFLALFGFATIGQAIMSVYKRFRWVTIMLAAGSAVECAGWACRLWSVQTWKWEPSYGGLWMTDHNSFIAQTCCLVIAPVFYSAANYVFLGRLVTLSTDHFSSLTPRQFAALFISADWVCLLVQAGGGGWAGTAQTPEAANQGAKLKSAGVMLQLCVTVAFIVLFAEFAWRFWYQRPTRHRYTFSRRGITRHARTRRIRTPNIPEETTVSSGTGLVPLKVSKRDETCSDRRVLLGFGWIVWTMLLIIARSVYRSIELLDGWKGPIAINQNLFLFADAMLMAMLAITTLVFHPHWLCKNTRAAYSPFELA